MTTNIYVLKLQNNKYYVGKSNNILEMYKQHVSGNGSAWTKKYKPINIEKTYTKMSDFDEDKITKMYMYKYGFNNVRGGSYIQIELDEIQILSLKRELWGAKNLCTNCGRSGHFIKNCFANTDVYGKQIYEQDSDEEDSDEESEDEYYSTSNYKKYSCFRCGRGGHYATSCYANTHIKGYCI